MTDRYNDGLDNETLRQIITTYRRPLPQRTKEIISDLGSVPKSLQGEMYYNYNYKDNSNKNTFHPVRGENDCEATPRYSPTEASTRPVGEEISLEKDVLALGGVMAAQPKIDKPGFRRLSTNDNYTQIGIQVSNVRTSGNILRANIYLSFKDHKDKKYTIWLTGNCTSSRKELIRGSKQNSSVIEVIDTLLEMNPGCMVARLRYKPKNGHITDFHRKNLKSCMASLYECNNQLYCCLYLLGEFIDICLDQQLTTEQQKYYDAAGLYRSEYVDFNDDEELE